MNELVISNSRYHTMLSIMVRARCFTIQYKVYIYTIQSHRYRYIYIYIYMPAMRSPAFLKTMARCSKGIFAHTHRDSSVARIAAAITCICIIYIYEQLLSINFAHQIDIYKYNICSSSSSSRSSST